MSSPLATRTLHRRFGDERAVDGIDIDVAAGEIHALVGLNGAGKTTLMRLLLGMLRPDAGRAVVLGHSAHEAPPNVWARVGHLIEAPFAYSELTTRENIAASARLHGLTDSDVDDAVAVAIDDFELGRWADRRAHTLSQGNRQRLGLASALVHGPSVLILDEPANALDPAGVVFIRDLLRKYADQDAAVLVSSHHLDQLARVADRISVLHRGRLVASLDPEGVDLERRFFDLVHEHDMKVAEERR